METESPKPEETLPDGRPAIGPDGVDVSLIRWMLSLTPAERLSVLEEQLRSIERLRASRVGQVIQQARACLDPGTIDQPAE